MTKYQLYIYLSKNRDDEEWVARYKKKVQDHNQKIHATATPDSGFDLFMPTDGVDYGYGVENLLSRQIITNPGITSCCMRVSPAPLATDLPPSPVPCGFYLYPRSSISKTRMRLANSVGIIDAGYRGDLIAAVDTIGFFGSTDIWHIWKETLSPINKYDRYFQVCAPDLSPFLIHIVDAEQDLSPPTDRGSGGFGSTGV